MNSSSRDHEHSITTGREDAPSEVSDVEFGSDWRHLARLIVDLRHQRDDLLAALKEMINCLATEKRNFQKLDATQAAEAVGRWTRAKTNARRAIAKATGQ